MEEHKKLKVLIAGTEAADSKKSVEKASLRVINGTYIAERFFGKSGSWFSQRLNNNVVNGRISRFTPQELRTLSTALITIAFELEDLAEDIEDLADAEEEASNHA